LRTFTQYGALFFPISLYEWSVMESKSFYGSNLEDVT
jgi:hypothetical protein